MSYYLVRNAYSPISSLCLSAFTVTGFLDHFPAFESFSNPSIACSNVMEQPWSTKMAYVFITLLGKSRGGRKYFICIAI